MFVLFLFGLINANLDPQCEAGDYEVTGHKTGKAVQMNYTSSYVHKDSDTTYLTLDFIVPAMYFYDGQNVSGTIYDRSFQISFHDRNLNPQIYNACYSTRQESGSENCPDVKETWSSQADPNDGCQNIVSGTLPWDKLMRFDFHEKSRIEIQTSNRTINGFNTPTWEVYMVAAIETWAGFEEVSTTVTNQVPNQLTINQERYSYYEIPFRISFPKQITLVASPIRIMAPMVTLYAVVRQEIININFNPQNGENFGQVEIDIVTQTQYPFGLRNFTDDVAPAIIRTSTGTILSVEWVKSDNPETCSSVTGVGDDNLCEQTWSILITPELCDVSGDYQMEMWAICFTDKDGCALDSKAETGTVVEKRNSNTWTGYMDFTVQAQNFCPQVIDEITVQGTIDKFADALYVQEAIPGSNVFSNDYVWFEVTYKTRSAKSGLAFSAGDDEIIEFVRPYNIDMNVKMTTLPLQTEVNRAGGDVTGTALNYDVNLCKATPAVFPYTNVVDDCFTTNQKGWNAVNYLDFNEDENQQGSNTIDRNEIGFRLRLDERVIPVDIPNDQAVVTIKVDSEVYYHGNENPARRRLTYNLRRNLQGEFTHRQTNTITETFSVPSKSNLAYCLLDMKREEVAFQLDVEMDRLRIPDKTNVVDHVMATKVGLSSYFHTGVNDIDVVGLHVCADNDNCEELWNIGKKRRQLKNARFVRYFLKVKGVDLGTKVQNDFYQNGAIYQTEMLKDTVVRKMLVDHCNNNLDQYLKKELIPGWKMGEGDAWNGVGATEKPIPQIDSSTGLLATWLSLAIITFLL